MLLLVRAFYELIRYELIYAIGGFQAVHRSVSRIKRQEKIETALETFTVCEAVATAACFYWKPVLCLQRAVVTTRLLRKCDIAAEMVIGYRPSPFFSHAWVEVAGTVVNDSPVYQQRLLVLERL